MVDLRTIDAPKIELVLVDQDIQIRFSGVWPPAMLWTAAGILTRVANKLVDEQEQQARAIANITPMLRREGH